MFYEMWGSLFRSKFVRVVGNLLIKAVFLLELCCLFFCSFDRLNLEYVYNRFLFN